ncbi:MAG: valine--tRNA ligase [Oligoflexia bacterium]|nr:valine--tRNA ligase [Oligoflexia bacterium]
MSEQSTSSLDKHFNFKEREAALYTAWEQAGIFRPEAASSKSAPVFNIAMPPPNANGELHLGHSYGYTVMDILGRFHRLAGERVLMLPGKDHAGIQTQVVFEKKLQAEKVDIKSIPTADLYKRCYDFCTDRAKYMRAQEKMLGLSADWSRELFTLDPRLSDIVFETFERMWKDGLIYRGSRIINWSVFSQTAISDVEVEYVERDGGLWYLSYPLVQPLTKSSKHELALPDGRKVKVGELGMVTATTRPETMLGDTALAVHPDDERYKDLVGCEAIVPLVGRRVRIIADKRVDPTYGTGVIKVTPAHDFADYDMGQDHKLELVQVIGKDGLMTKEAGAEFAGLSTKQCREAVLKRLAEEGRLLAESTIKHKVPVGERGKDVIEPLVSEQWFVNVDKAGNSLKRRALEMVKAGKIKIYPARFQVLFEQWLENLRDWNISRQIWWGHRLPVWYRKQGDKEEVHVGRQAPAGAGWTQDTDTFDTWFSSGQWAYSTFAAHGMVNLDKTPASNEFFPSHTMVMGRDILFFWACRMLLLTTYRLGDVPWKNIFFTGLIRDEHGQKMSKSKGNGIEPNDVISRHGTDALRLSLVMGASPGNDIIVSERKIEGYSKFINKLWNAAKLIEMKTCSIHDKGLPAQPTLAANRWILRELARVHRNVTQKMQEYEISIAADELYGFSWTVFCDWYLEMMKVLIDTGNDAYKQETATTVREVFRRILIMLHPFVPYISEELYQKVAGLKRTAFLAGESWDYKLQEVEGTDEVSELMEIVGAIRSVKSALNISSKRIAVSVPGARSAELSLLIKELARVDFVSDAQIPGDRALRKPFSGGVLVLDVDGKENYQKRLEKDAELNRSTIAGIEKKLSGEFATHAKAELVERERERLEQSRKALQEIEKELAMMVQ